MRRSRGASACQRWRQGAVKVAQREAGAPGIAALMMQRGRARAG